MCAITGVTGHVGGATARELLAAGARVRVVVRDPEKGRSWSQSGAEVAVTDFADRTALAAALAGCRGAFVMLPTIATATDAEHRGLADSIAAAVAGSGVPHVAALSSVGADLAEGTGPVRWLHHLENRLRESGTVLTAIRSPHFQEKAETVLGSATGTGAYPVFGDADIPIPMVATRDVGTAVAESLLSPPPAGEVIDLIAPSYTERQVAEKLGAALGRALRVVTIPRRDWLDALTNAGVPPLLAAELVDLYDADHRGVLQPRGDRRRSCTTTLDETLRQLVGTASV
ncbi:MAG: NmrA family NAD(P)-binding protein [Pseudonocardia sp.]